MLSELIKLAADELSRCGDMKVQGYCKWKNAFFDVEAAKKTELLSSDEKEVLNVHFTITDVPDKT